MTIRHRGMLTVVCLVAVACRREVPASDGAGTTAEANIGAALDTARGVLQIVGSEPLTTLLLVPRDSTQGPVALRSDEASVLRQANGLEVMVRGQRLPERDLSASPQGVAVFAATAFVVRAADGEPAVDGILEQRGSGYVLRLSADSVRTIGTLPLALRDAVGARVYLVGPLAAPSSWGVLRSR